MVAAATEGPEPAMVATPTEGQEPVMVATPTEGPEPVMVADPTLPLGRGFVPIARLVLPAWNPRAISPSEMDRLCRSIRERPWLLLSRPVLVADGPRNRAGRLVHGGNMRTRALQRLYKEGWAPPAELQAQGWRPGTVPVDVVDIPETEAKAVTAIDNNSWGTWDQELLGQLTAELDQLGVDTQLLGFDPVLLAQVNGQTAEAAVARPTPGTQPAASSRRTGTIDAIYTVNGISEVACCLAVKAGFLFGIQSGNQYCPRAEQAKGRHWAQFVDNAYADYDHAVHLADVRRWQPKYCTVRDIMTREQCLAAGIAYYELEQILDWAEELATYAQNVILIPKVDVIDRIPEKFMLGYSVPSSHGATPLGTDAFRGRRVHLLGGSWKMQLAYLADLGDDVVSLDHNYLQKVANYGQYVAQDGTVRELKDIGFPVGALSNPRYVAIALSLGAIAARLNELQPGTMQAEADAGVLDAPLPPDEDDPEPAIVVRSERQPREKVELVIGDGPPVVRQATAADLDRIKALADRLVPEIGFVLRPALVEAIQRGELLFEEQTGAFLHYHVRRRDGVAVVYEVAVPEPARGRRIGQRLLAQVPLPIELKCPVDNASNGFYRKLGFTQLRTDKGKKRELNVWRRETPIADPDGDAPPGRPIANPDGDAPTSEVSDGA